MKARRPAFKLEAPRVPEFALHEQIADAFRLELAPAGRISKDGVVFWSVDIAAYSGSAPGIRTRRGVVAGIPDMIVLYRGRAYFIEIKAEDGSVSPAQRDVAFAILACGSRYAVVRSAAEALACLDAWEIPHAKRIRGVA